MQFLSWCYSHIIRATGVTALGLLEIDKESDAAKTERPNEAKLYARVIQRLFELTLRYAQDRIDELEKAQKAQKTIEELKYIVEDCKMMIDKFKIEKDSDD